LPALKACLEIGLWVAQASGPLPLKKRSKQILTLTHTLYSLNSLNDYDYE